MRERERQRVNTKDEEYTEFDHTDIQICIARLFIGSEKNGYTECEVTNIPRGTYNLPTLGLYIAKHPVYANSRTNSRYIHSSKFQFSLFLYIAFFFASRDSART